MQQKIMLDAMALTLGVGHVKAGLAQKPLGFYTLAVRHYLFNCYY